MHTVQSLHDRQHWMKMLVCTQHEVGQQRLGEVYFPRLLMPTQEDWHAKFFQLSAPRPGVHNSLNSANNTFRPTPLGCVCNCKIGSTFLIRAVNWQLWPVDFPLAAPAASISIVFPVNRWGGPAGAPPEARKTVEKVKGYLSQ